MVKVRNHIRFVLNAADVVLEDAAPDDTLLDYLRLDRHLYGTKEGCAEGDCGACTVLVGKLSGGTLEYHAVNACICLIGSLDACHVVTIEHLTASDGALHPLQQAMVDNHASQCGFCTPGIVMSLYGLWMARPDAPVEEIEKALQGNLCRCTGYRPVIAAARAAQQYGMPENDPLVKERAEIAARLKAMHDGRRIETTHDGKKLIVPASPDDLAALLVDHPGTTIIAGATDAALWVTKSMRDISPAVFVSGLAGLAQVSEDETGITIGAGVTYSQLAGVMARHYPQLVNLWHRIGGRQVRNMGTIGGNIANGSPIGDTPPALICLGATLTLRRGNDRRKLPLEDFFIAYGRQDRREGEFIETIHIPALAPGDHFAVYKISKRRDEDISSVCGAFRITLEGDTVSAAKIAFGGMAAIPKRAKKTEAALDGRPWNMATIKDAQAALLEDFTPLSDWRASARYRSLTAANLLMRFFLETIGENTQLVRHPATGQGAS
ncbi:MAG TPA: xanthine dehydrogenase small subunit [Rhizobiales bacterium]|nr:xanthine dehydrogenase small subunit [Hyphomicrobiales bacterium]